MILKTDKALKWHEFELLAGYPLIHATFTRRGGVSQGALDSLNVGSRVGDMADNIAENLQRIKKALSLAEICMAKSYHGAEVAAVNSSSAPRADGISTDNPGLSLCVTHADCQAALFYDPVKHALANVHCGWRGNVQNIYAAAVAHMRAVYQSQPENLLVCISPSLGPEHAEFIHYKTELPEAFWNYQVRPLYFDLWAVSRSQLLAAGVLPQHIQIAGIDTYAQAEDYFSYRRNKSTGRMATVCMLI